MPEERRTAKHKVAYCESLEHLPDGLALWAPFEVSDEEAPLEALREAVRSAVATALTPKQREVVEAYYFEGRSQREIAHELGVTQQVVQKRLFGARRNQRTVGGALARLREVLSPAMSHGG